MHSLEACERSGRDDDIKVGVESQPRKSNADQRTRYAAMIKSELIALLAVRQDALTRDDIDEAVSIILEQISQALSAGERIEIRGFGSFTLHARRARVARNPRTGELVALPVRHVPHFRAGKELRERVQMAA